MKAGLEVHQQLATRKLFCACPSELSEEVERTATRRLRATGGENHQVDAAAAFQAARGLTFRYEAAATSCLVELDEEPPHALNPEAVDVALSMALLLHARPLDEIEVMRKIVVDGSNTAGFQRTALVAVDGSLELSGRTYSIPTICLEEDAARKVGESHEEVRYRLDRLGIPLIEIATGPEITSGGEAREVAEELGMLLRATGKVRRGIGTIREDLNVSTAGGSRVEIKGVQELKLIHRYAELEEERQRVLLQVAEQLRERQARVPHDAAVDLSDLLRPIATGTMGESLAKGGQVLGVGLVGFHGLLRSPKGTHERLGRELADQGRASGLRGLFHSDEVPEHGVSDSTAADIRRALGLAAPDAFVLVAAREPAVAQRSIEAIRRRAAQAIQGIPSETRDPLPDGRTRYSRPLPGRDRMYPETDVPPVLVTPERLRRLAETLPERPEVTRERIARTYQLSVEAARQLLRSGDLDTFETLVGRGHSAPAVVRLLSQDIPGAVPEGAAAAALAQDLPRLDQLLRALEMGAFSKEGVPAVLAELGKGATDVEDAVRRSGLTSMTSEELRALARQLVRDNAAVVRSRGSAAFSPLMGDLMKAVRGRRDGKEVADVLRSALAEESGRGDAGPG